MSTSRSFLSQISLPLLTIAALCLPGLVSAQGRFMTLDYPLAGVTDTEATAINPSGVIVGRYFTGSGASRVQHGFVLENGVYTSVDFPGAVGSAGTDIEWINANGTISGTYGTATGANAYTLRKGAYTKIAASGATETFGFGISDSGIVTGPQCACSFTTASGYMYSQGVFTPINYPGAVGTFPTMLITPEMVVGAFYDGSNYHGFYYYNGAFVKVDHPGAYFTWFSGVNPEGEMTGYYQDGTGQHGLLYSITTGAMVSVDVPVPGSYSSEVNGIDPQGDIVGRYIGSDGNTHGYFWSGH